MSALALMRKFLYCSLISYFQLFWTIQIFR